MDLIGLISEGFAVFRDACLSLKIFKYTNRENERRSGDDSRIDAIYRKAGPN